ETVDAALATGWKGVATQLRARIPSAEPAALVHGDFRLGNMLAVGPDITAIVDWEIWALSDPRVDLGWFLLTADPETYGRGTEYVGSLPTPAELSGIYADVRGTDVPDLHWFQALACFKSVAVWSLIIKHNRRRAEPAAAIEGVAAALPRLLERAPQLVSATDEASRRQW